jgi:hypothetical protein
MPGVENGYLSFVHEGVSLDEFQQVCLNVGTDDAVRLYHCASLGIHIIPRPPQLCVEPSP